MTLSSFVIKVKADSGFGGSYGGGGGGGSSYSSSSSSSGGSGKPLTPEGLYALFPMFIYMVLIVILSIKLKTVYKYLVFFGTLIIHNIFGFVIFGSDYLVYAISVSGVATLMFGMVMFSLHAAKQAREKFFKNDITELNTEEMQNELFGIYKDIQIAWSENKIEKVRKKLTDELINTYKFQIDSMVTLNQRNAMEDIEFVRMVVSNHEIVNNIEKIEVIMEVTCKDYIVQMVDGKEKVIRGTSSRTVDYIYRMTFVRNVKVSAKYCTNCGSKLEEAMSERCKYCNSILVHETTKYVLAKKEVLLQTFK